MNKISTLLFILLVVTSCKKENTPVNLSDTPEISFKNIDYYITTDTDTPVPTEIETVEVSFKYLDGGKDLGLDYTYSDSPYHQLNYYYFNDSGEPAITSDGTRNDLITIGNIDTLPAYNCENYIIGNAFGSMPFDTIYVQPNKYFFNLIVNIIEYKNGIPQQFEVGNCRLENYNARFNLPDQNQSNKGLFEILKYDQYSGQITYKMSSSGFFSAFFKNKEISFKMQIIDRALNESNWIETDKIRIE